MALSRARPADIPKDAVVMTEDEALSYQWNTIQNWKPASDVWAIRHSCVVSAVLTGLTSIYVNNHYRSKLRLGNYGKFSTYLPIVVVPSLFTVLTRRLFIEQPSLLNPLANCPVCLMLRSAAWQVSCGAIYPVILAPFAAFMFATRHFTYRLPSLTENPKDVFRLWMKFTKPLVPAVGSIIIGQALISMFLTFKQIEQNLNVQMKMQKLEEEMEQKAVEAGAARNFY